MRDTAVGRVLEKAVKEADFRRRLIQNLGGTLAEEGFILTDSEMGKLREHWSTWQGLNSRAAYEQIAALAHSYRRE